MTNKGDLISRSELKDRLAKHQSILDFEWDSNNLIASIIDNAPTVPLPDFKEGYKQAIIDGKAQYQRPKGKWVYVPDKHQYYCSCCRHWSYDCKLFDFCQDCGADMRGKEE